MSSSSLMLVFILFMVDMALSLQSFQVLGIDHGSAPNGQYFNFMAQDVDTYLGRTNWDNQIFTAYVHRLRAPVQVRLWRQANGGTNGNAHGRVEPYGSKKSSDWRVGDVITLIRGTVTVLSNDHNAFPDGNYFNFDIATVDAALGRADWSNELFMLYNYRLKQTVEEKLWRQANGGSRGNAHGRKEPYASKRSSDWRVGDKFALLDGFKVKSIDHGSMPTGEYFNFMKSDVDKILGRTDWMSEKFKIYNARSGETVAVIMWRQANGGSIGGAHGRREPYSDKSPTDWKVNDVLTIVDEVDV